jgi:adenine-specific DNA-methyltransferase
MESKVLMQWDGRARYYSASVPPLRLTPLKGRSVDAGNTDNLIIEGDNIGTMAALLHGAHAMRGKVDILLWDPPYNTGRKDDFRYSDDFYLTKREVAERKAAKEAERAAARAAGRKPPASEDDVVSINDTSRHTKWLNFMAIRLWYGKKLLKKNGLVALTIDDRELFRCGMLMDEIFGEENRLACVPWKADPSGGEKKKALRSGHEYVLIYHNGDPSSVSHDERSVGPLNLRDSNGPYRKGAMLLKWGDNSLASDRPTMHFPVSAPDGTPALPYRNDGKAGCWRWGSPGKMDAVKQDPEQAHWEKVEYDDGLRVNGQRERWVPYEKIRDSKRAIGWSTWLDSHGTNAEGTAELTAIFGTKVFGTPKPLALYEWIIRLHGSEEAVVLDAFAGSGTTAHAVLNVNASDGGRRRFILIESGQGADKYCDSLTAERVRRVISGKYASGKRAPVPGGFLYMRAQGEVKREQIMQARREELADIILQAEQESSGVMDCRIENPDLSYVIGRTRKGNAIALVWGSHGTELGRENYAAILSESKHLGLTGPVYIYATRNGGPNGSTNYVFNLIPDKILAAMGVSDDV